MFMLVLIHETGWFAASKGRHKTHLGRKVQYWKAWICHLETNRDDDDNDNDEDDVEDDNDVDGHHDADDDDDEDDDGILHNQTRWCFWHMRYHYPHLWKLSKLIIML